MSEQSDLAAVVAAVTTPNPALDARTRAIRDALRAEAAAAGQPIDERALLIEASRRALDEQVPLPGD